MAPLTYLKDDLGRIVGIQWREPLPQRAENGGERGALPPDKCLCGHDKSEHGAWIGNCFSCRCQRFTTTRPLIE